jgi:hypothetical protein
VAALFVVAAFNIDLRGDKLAPAFITSYVTPAIFALAMPPAYDLRYTCSELPCAYLFSRINGDQCKLMLSST